MADTHLPHSLTLGTQSVSHQLSYGIIGYFRDVKSFNFSLKQIVSLSGESSMGGWDGLIALLLLLPALCLPDSIQGSSNPELSVAPRERRAVPLYVNYNYNPGQHKLVEPYYRPQESNGIAADKNDLVNQSEPDLYMSYSAGMWVIGGLFTLASVITPGVVSAFTSAEPSKIYCT